MALVTDSITASTMRSAAATVTEIARLSGYSQSYLSYISRSAINYRIEESYSPHCRFKTQLPVPQPLAYAVCGCQV